MIPHQQLATQVGCHPLTLDNEVRKGHLVQHRDERGRKYYQQSDVDAWLTSRRAHGMTTFEVEVEPPPPPERRVAGPPTAEAVLDFIRVNRCYFWATPPVEFTGLMPTGSASGVAAEATPLDSCAAAALEGDVPQLDSEASQPDKAEAPQLYSEQLGFDL